MADITKPYEIDWETPDYVEGIGGAGQTPGAIWKLDQNQIKLYTELNNVRELYAGETAPENPNTGQLWLDTSVYQIKQYTGSAWAVVTNYIDIKWFNDDLSQAVTSIGSSEVNLIIPRNITVSADTTVPENICLVIPKGGKITVSSGVTLTLNCPIQAGLWQIFDGDGTVSCGTEVGAVYPEWFGITGTNDQQGITKAISSVSEGGMIAFVPGKSYSITGDPAVHFNKRMIILFNNCIFNYSGSGTAVKFGGDSGRIFNLETKGPLRVNRIDTIIHDGTQSASSQLLGTALKFEYIQNSKFEGHFYVSGFKYGYYFGKNASSLEVHNPQSVDCLIDYYFDPSSDAGSFVTAIDIYSPYNSFNPSHYSDITGSRGVEFVKNGNTNDGHNFIGGVLEAQKERKIKIEANACNFIGTYLDQSNGGTDIEVVSGAAYNRFICNDLHLQNIVDNGTYTYFMNNRDFYVDSSEDKVLGNSATFVKVRVYQNDSFAYPDYYELPSGVDGWVEASLTKDETPIGNSTTQWDITNPSGNIFRYTWNGVGTDPGLTANSQLGKVKISGGTFSAGNTGTFDIVAVGDNYFEIENSSGVVESGVSGDVVQWIAEKGTWVFTSDGKVHLVSGTYGTSDVYAKDTKLSIGSNNGQIQCYNRLRAAAKLRLIIYFF